MKKLAASGLVAVGIAIGAGSGSVVRSLSASPVPVFVPETVIGSASAACLDKVASGLSPNAELTLFACRKAPTSLDGAEVVAWSCSGSNGAMRGHR